MLYDGSFNFFQKTEKSCIITSKLLVDNSKLGIEFWLVCKKNPSIEIEYYVLELICTSAVIYEDLIHFSDFSHGAGTQEINLCNQPDQDVEPKQSTSQDTRQASDPCEKNYKKSKKQ